MHSVFLLIGGNNDYSEDLLFFAVEANNSFAFTLLLSNRASPKKLADKVKEILDQRQNTYVVNHSNSPHVFLNNFENLLKKLIEFSYIKDYPIKSKEILVLSLSICSMCLPDDPLLKCKTLKDECRKIIRETTNFSRVYGSMKNLGIPKSMQRFLFCEKELTTFKLGSFHQKFVDLLENEVIFEVDNSTCQLCQQLLHKYIIK